MNREEWLKRLKELHTAEYNLCCKKNQDYSSSEDPFANFRLFNELGFLVRMSDKLSRLKQYIANNKLSVEDESVVDTLMDLSNYANLLIGFLEDKNHE